ncbi:XF1762 family protein, partial [Pseudomonas aeruginosa]
MPSEHHRHHRSVQGAKFAIAVALPGSDGICGVAIVGRPVARHLDDGWTLEVTRLCTNGAPNACSKLYGAAWKAAKALGYTRLITYSCPRKAVPACAPPAGGWSARAAAAPGAAPAVAALTPPSTCAAPSACGRRQAARTKGNARMPIDCCRAREPRPCCPHASLTAVSSIPGSHD